MNITGAMRALLAASRGLRDQPTLTPIASAGRDRSLVLVGGSPFGSPIDASGSFLEVPATPSAADNRYLFRACALPIPPGKAARVVGIGEYTEIAAPVPNLQTGGAYIVRRQVVEPAWAFPDGNVARGLSTVRTPPNRARIFDPGQLPSTDNNLDELAPALIYQPNPSGPFPYLAPNGGRWPGSPVPGLSLWKGRRFSWTLAGPPLDYSVSGGNDLVYWISVKQTDPQTRVTLDFPQGGDLGALSVEDRMVLQYPLTQYSRVGGFMVVEIGPSSRDDRQQFSPDLWAFAQELMEAFEGQKGTDETGLCPPSDPRVLREEAQGQERRNARGGVPLLRPAGLAV